MNAPTIYTDPSQSPETVVILTKMQELEKHLENMPDVTNEQAASLVSEYRTQLRKQAKELDTERLEMTKPIRDLTTTLNQKYNVHIERAERAAKLCDSLLMPWMKEQKRLRDEAEAKARQEAEEVARLKKAEDDALRKAQQIATETADAEGLKEAELDVNEARAALNELGTRTGLKPNAPPPAKSVTGALGSTTGLREVWKYRVVDISKVPEEYLVDPEDRIKKRELNKIDEGSHAGA